MDYAITKSTGRKPWRGHFVEPKQIVANLCQRMIRAAPRLRLETHRYECGTRVIDCGVKAPGSLEAGRLLAEVCLGGLGKVRLLPVYGEGLSPPGVMVRTDHPVAACMASQYAGWRISGEGYFAMGSGPMRALAAREPLFATLGPAEGVAAAVGVLESSRLPPEEVCRKVAAACGVPAGDLVLAVARTASQAGGVQIVARSVETAMHKLLELGADLSQVESGFGAAPLPPAGGDDLEAMGRTNDAILYGGEVTLWVRGEDQTWATLGPRIPSSASPDHGRPFVEIFQRYGRDFYRIDPLLFGPAVITLANLDTGRSLRFGRRMPEVLRRWVEPGRQ
jgi:methenyltetrahydromethanopterin cyclohydrolase